MRSLRWIGLVFSLLIVGVLGGLMAPLPSEADNNTPPTVTIDGASVTLTRIANVNGVCPNDTAFNSCWSINGTNVTTESTRNQTIQFGRYFVGDYSASNGARILINDSSAVGSVDNMKMTGITFSPSVSSPTPDAHVIIVHTFNEGGGNPRGSYKWGMAMGGQFDPPDGGTGAPAAENVVGDRLRVTASGVFTSTVNLGSLDTCPLCSPPAATPTTPPKTGFDSPTATKLVGYVTKSVAAAVKVSDCNMTGSKCFPTVTLDYTIRTVGLDQLQLSDSFSGCGSSCCGDGEVCGSGDGGFPLPLCTDEDLLCDPKIVASVQAIEDTGIASGGVEACSGDCIVTIVKATPAKKGGNQTFEFTATGPGVGPPLSPFSITTAANGIGYHTSKDLTAGGDRVFMIPVLNSWEIDNIICVSLLNNGTSTYTVEGSSVKGPLHVTLGAGDTFTCTWHLHK
jgi:hypothetical protein